MAETWYPNPSVTQLQHERLMGGAASSGVFGTPADLPVVYAPNSGTREVRIRASRRAVVEGYGWENDAVEIVLPSLAANGTGSTRIDLVVLRLDRSDWSAKVKVVQGTAGAGAPAPTYTIGASGVWELPLAEVTVAAGATTLASSTVTNRAWYIGSDGQLICTPTTQPPVEAGRTAWDTTLAAPLVSDGTVWRRADWNVAWGRIVGRRYDAGPTVLLATIAAGFGEAHVNMQSGYGTLVAGRSYAIHAAVRVKAVGSAGDINIRLSSDLGVYVGYKATTLPNTVSTYEQDIWGVYSCASNESRGFGVNMVSGASTGVNVYAGTSTGPVLIEVWDVGPTGLTVVP